MGIKRFDLFFEQHIGLGIRWRRWNYPFELSISVMCVTVVIGFGRALGSKIQDMEAPNEQ